MKAVIVFLLAIWSGVTYAASATQPVTQPADARPAALKVDVAVPERGKVVALDDRSHFHVVITNVSDRPQKVIDEWNSWGYFNLRLEYTTAAGERKVMEKQGRAWDKNFLTTTTLNPGEVLVRDLLLDDTIWSNLPVPAVQGREAKVRMRALFEQKAEEGVDAWQGQVTSPEQEITFRNYRQSR